MSDSKAEYNWGDLGVESMESFASAISEEFPRLQQHREQVEQLQRRGRQIVSQAQQHSQVLVSNLFKNMKISCEKPTFPPQVSAPKVMLTTKKAVNYCLYFACTRPIASRTSIPVARISWSANAGSRSASSASSTADRCPTFVRRTHVSPPGSLCIGSPAPRPPMCSRIRVKWRKSAACGWSSCRGSASWSPNFTKCRLLGPNRFRRAAVSPWSPRTDLPPQFQRQGWRSSPSTCPPNRASSSGAFSTSRRPRRRRRGAASWRISANGRNGRPTKSCANEPRSAPDPIHFRRPHVDLGDFPLFWFCFSFFHFLSGFHFVWIFVANLFCSKKFNYYNHQQATANSLCGLNE